MLFAIHDNSLDEIAIRFMDAAVFFVTMHLVNSLCLALYNFLRCVSNPCVSSINKSTLGIKSMRPIRNRPTYVRPKSLISAEAKKSPNIDVLDYLTNIQ